MTSVAATVLTLDAAETGVGGVAAAAGSLAAVCAGTGVCWLFWQRRRARAQA
ncbi:hypothetical protein [Nocardia stercoris]|uniref:hypothetical protein n=1 Tax=Nocardia stercoris TaxID=2483361 RepID=UPI00131A2893|nr:hypothetical protein [Nocardia stercoris]